MSSRCANTMRGRFGPGCPTLEANWDEAVSCSSAGRARVWRLYMAGSAMGFAANRLGVNQVLAVTSARHGRSGMPATRAELLRLS